MVSCGSVERLVIVVLLAVARAQVRNLHFQDIDTSALQVGGIVRWDQPAAGPFPSQKYQVAFATSCSDATCMNGAGVATGCANFVNVGYLRTGAWTSEFSMTNQALGGCSGNTCTHIVVHDGTNIAGTIACARLFDNPSSTGRTYYMAITGLANANTAKAALVTNGHAQEYLIDMEMVASAKAGLGGTIDEQGFDFDNPESAIWKLTFPSGAAAASVTQIDGISTHDYTPIVFTGTGASTAHAVASGRVHSVLDGNSPIRPDPDIARHYLRSCIRLNLAYAGYTNYEGQFHLLTRNGMGTSSIPAGIQDLLDVYMDYGTAVSYSTAGSTSTDMSSITSHVTKNNAECEQVSSSHGANCLTAASI